MLACTHLTSNPRLLRAGSRTGDTHTLLLSEAGVLGPREVQVTTANPPSCLSEGTVILPTTQLQKKKKKKKQALANAGQGT
ncbi:hypothetical protein NDU88_001004 [Pleurodeles waltl]|uniref:Uncharacterized protein n=1 Tax=Pleurodeles waltl TaxID=8319 RepID=A0AAV7S8K7_PLEWA|nr:hypothetical protein NDU88_001004 [Pleurodeles waltl]